MIFIKTNEGNYYGIGQNAQITSLNSNGAFLVCMDACVLATCESSEAAQLVKDQIVAAIHTLGGIGTIKLVTSAGGVTEVIIDDL